MHHLFPLTLHAHKICATQDIIECQGVEWKGYLGLFPCTIYIDADTQEIAVNQEQHMPQIRWNPNGTIHSILQKPIHTPSLELFNINPDDIVKLPANIVEACCMQHPDDYDRVAHILSDTLGYLADPIHGTKRDIIQRLINATYPYLDANDHIIWCNIQQIEQAYPIYDLIQWAEPHAIMYENMENHNSRSQWTCRPSVSHILRYPQPYTLQDPDEDTLPHNESSIINILYNAISMGIPSYPRVLPMPFGPYLPFISPPTPSINTMPPLTALPTITPTPITNEAFPIVFAHEHQHSIDPTRIQQAGYIQNIPITIALRTVKYKDSTIATLTIRYNIPYTIPDWGRTNNPIFAHQYTHYTSPIIHSNWRITHNHWINLYTQSHPSQQQKMIQQLLLTNNDNDTKERQQIIKILAEHERTHHPTAFNSICTTTHAAHHFSYIGPDNNIYPLWKNTEKLIQWIYASNTTTTPTIPNIHLRYNNQEHQWNGVNPKTVFEKPTTPLPPPPSQHAMLQTIRRAIALGIPQLPIRFTPPD